MAQIWPFFFYCQQLYGKTEHSVLEPSSSRCAEFLLIKLFVYSVFSNRHRRFVVTHFFANSGHAIVPFISCSSSNLPLVMTYIYVLVYTLAGPQRQLDCEAHNIENRTKQCHILWVFYQRNKIRNYDRMCRPLTYRSQTFSLRCLVI